MFFKTCFTSTIFTKRERALHTLFYSPCAHFIVSVFQPPCIRINLLLFNSCMLLAYLMSWSRFLVVDMKEFRHGVVYIAHRIVGRMKEKFQNKPSGKMPQSFTAGLGCQGSGCLCHNQETSRARPTPRPRRVRTPPCDQDAAAGPAPLCGPAAVRRALPLRQSGNCRAGRTPRPPRVRTPPVTGTRLLAPRPAPPAVLQPCRRRCPPGGSESASREHVDAGA